MKAKFIITSVLFLSSCNVFSDGAGQVIFHWEREKTGIEKFSRDHSECMRKAEDTRLIPDVRGWLFSEEVTYNLRPQWHAEKGIWASYVPYDGAQPILVNSIRNSENSNPRQYRICMENRGYWHRTHSIPTTTNLFVYKPQTLYQDMQFELGNFMK